MAKEKLAKTNVMRILESNKINYKGYSYLVDGTLTGLDCANILGENPDRVFKTLVTVGHSKNYYVFVIPVNRELDLKKCAKAVNEKSVEMIKQRELLPLTGYVHGGCSPIGMKKPFFIVFHNSASFYKNIIFSGGKIGFQVEVNIFDCENLIKFDFADIVVK